MQPSTGIPALDELLYGLRPGDNLVWKVEMAEDYAAPTEPFWSNAVRRGEPLIYFRFAEHAELVPRANEVTRVELHPEEGFERFITEVHRTIAEAPPGSNYVFDMFSDMVCDWFSERMIGNFFLLTCPYLHALGTVAYYGVLRNFHSYHAMQPIDETSELLLDVYRWEGKLYLHPLKVAQRYSPTMHLMHRWDDGSLTPVTDSATTAAIARSAPWPGLQSASYRMIGMWDRRFMAAEETLAAFRRGTSSAEAVGAAFERLAMQLLSREPRMLALIRQYMTLDDLLDVWKHVVGSGMVGGKTVGMLLGRAMLRQADDKWARLLEQHDSFFIASDVFYSFLVQNDCWWIRQKQKNPLSLLDGIEEARSRILKGVFPAYLLSRFSDMLDYFGQCPIVVRSSSLLEDAFGNAFAGKYETVFCPNQGTRQQRLEEFLNAVRIVYASALSEGALRYRARRKVLDRDEQMALLVQRVSGMQYGGVFYPELAGVGLSFNPFVWHPEIDPAAGVLRMVFGLGTRAVERADDDYTRIVALNVPFKRPEGSPEDVREHAQRRVDYLDLRRNMATTGYFGEVAEQSPGLPVEWFAERDAVVGRDGIARPGGWGIELDRILERIPLVEDMRQMLATLRAAYGCHVDVEFTANVRPDDGYRINLLQCRPLHVRECDARVVTPSEVSPEHLVLHACGAVLGYSRVVSVDRLIYVVPDAYAGLAIRERYALARLVGKLTHARGEGRSERLMLLGPGRWGTSLPELGIPVTFGDINTVSVLCEIDAMHEGLSPDLSLGTHFFHELAEFDMLYLGYARNRPGNFLNQRFLTESPNHLAKLLPSESAWARVIRVIQPAADRQLVLTADHIQQEAVLFLDPTAAPT